VRATTIKPGANAIESINGSVTITGTAKVTADASIGDGSAISAGGAITIETTGNVKADADVGFSLEAGKIIISNGTTELTFNEAGGEAWNKDPEISGDETEVRVNGKLVYPSTPVTNIIRDFPETVAVGTPLTLSGDVVPANATNKTIVWSLASAGNTGAVISGDTFSATAAGTAVVTATITDGIVSGDYTQDFPITVNVVPVTDIIRDFPETVAVGTPLTLSGDVVPANATNKTIVWSLANVGSTDARISGDTFSATAAGIAVVTATITDGIVSGDYTQDFPIRVNVVPVTNITGVPTTTTVGARLTLSGDVVPTNATNKTIVWSLASAGNTGAVIISGDTFSATAAGTATVRATITDGIVSGDYTQDFPITVRIEDIEEAIPEPDFYGNVDKVLAAISGDVFQKDDLIKITRLDSEGNSVDVVIISENIAQAIALNHLKDVPDIDIGKFKEPQVTPLPILESENLDDNGVANIYIPVKGYELFFKHPEEILLLKIVGRDEGEFLYYVTKAAEKTDDRYRRYGETGTFTLMTEDGMEEFTGEINNNGKYMLLVFIEDGDKKYDLDGTEDGKVVDPIALVGPDKEEYGDAESGGCSSGLGIMAFALIFPVIMATRRKK